MTIATPRGAGRSMTSLSYDVSVSYGQTAGDWFGPLAPPRPLAPPEVAGRTWDFVPGYNLNITPRPYEQIDFATLRALADSYDPLRLIIERRKDQMCRLPWTIRVKHDAASKRPKTAELPASTRSRIKDITQFLQHPDYDVSFRSWLRGLLEDLFVIDAPAIYCERTYGGTLTAMQLTDGSTIKRVIDERGRTPRPIIWTGAPFTWNGETVTAENYQALGFKRVDRTLFPPAYQQILKGLPAVSLSALDLIYRPLNVRPGHVYGMSQTEQVLMTVSTAMRRATHQLEYYREGNQPEGLYSLPTSWTPDQVQRFQDYWDNLFVGNLGRRRQMRFVAGDGSYTPLKEPPLKTEFDEWLVRIVCFAFSYPATAFVHQVNRATAEQHERQAEKEGLEPIKLWASELFNDVIEREFDADDLEFAWAEEEEIDPEKQATVLRGYAESGVLTLNQVRARLGEDPDPSPNANRLMVKTATGYVPIDTTEMP